MSSLQHYQNERERLFGIAYRMLGSVSDAEDILQDAYLKWSRVKRDDIENPQAYLVTLVTRLCIDQLRSAKAMREQYVGEWLPEPLVQAVDEISPNAILGLSQSLSTAFMRMLEALNPLERAVFLLRQAFDFSHREVAEVINKSVENTRQIDRRARRKLQGESAVTGESRDIRMRRQDQQYFLLFMHACQQAELSPLLDRLAKDAVMYSDGGGKAVAVIRPLYGAERIRQLFAVLPNKQEGELSSRFAVVNSLPALMFYVDDRLDTVMNFEFEQGEIKRIYAMRNPDKLKHIESLQAP